MSDPRTGEILSGRYEFGELIGEGAMGRVHRGLDRATGAAVAIKLMRMSAAPADPYLIKRFEREIATLKRLAHPNILEYRDHGRHGELLFLVTELLEGQSLADASPSFAGQVEKIVMFGARLARAFAAAHAEGVIHRDIKPKNLWITRAGEPRILDFGLARWIRAPGPPEEAPTITRLTQDGTLLGTIAYMSPEQLRGERADHRSDVFSLAVVIYEVVSGRLPYEGRTRVELLATMESGPPATLGSLRPDLREAGASALDLILHKALQSSAGKRFQGMDDLAAAMERSLDLHRSIPADATLSILIPPAVSFEEAGPRSLVGREREIAFVRGALERARAGHGAAILVEGPQGSGRSRFANEIVRIGHRQSFLCLAASAAPPAPTEDRGLSRGSLPARAWLERAKEVFPNDPAILHALERPKKTPIGIDLEGIAPTGSAGTDVVLSALSALADRLPILLVLDDLHEGGPQTVDLASRLPAFASGRRILSLVTCRSDAPPPLMAESALERYLAMPSLQRLVLPPLTQDDLRDLSEGVYPGLNLPEPFLRQLAERTEGNPAYVLGVLRLLEGTGHLERSGAGWRLDEVDELPVPREAQSVVAERIAVLDTADRALLEAAAVLGHGFGAAQIARVQKLDRESVEVRLSVLARRNHLVLREAGGWRFDHTMTREVLYRGMPPERRAELHGKAADALLTGSIDEPRSRTSASVARHYLEAGRYAEAMPYVIRAGLDLNKEGSPEEAIPWLGRARLLLENALGVASEPARNVLREQLAHVEVERGHCLYQISRHSEALSTLGTAQAIAASEGLQELRAKAHLLTAACHLARGDMLLAQRRAREAQQVARDARLEAERALALSIEAHALSRAAEPGEAEARWEEAASILEKAGRPEDTAEVHFRLANHHFRLKQYSKAREGYQRAAALVPQASPRLYGRIQNSRGALILAQGTPREALPLFQEAALVRESIGSRRGLGTSLHNIAECHSDLGELEEACRIYERVIPLRRETGENARRADSQHNYALVLLVLGRIEKAMAEAEEALLTKRELEDAVHLPACLNMLGEIELEIGRSERALALFGEALHHEHANPDEALRATVGVAQAEWLAGRDEQSTDRFRQAMALLGKRHAEASKADQATEIAARLAFIVFLRTQDAAQEEIEAVASPLKVLETASVLPEPRMWLLTARAQDSAGAGRVVEARENLSRALDLSMELGAVERTWRIQRDLALLDPSGSRGRSERLRAAAGMLDAQARAIRNAEVRQAYLAHRERAELRRLVAS